VISVRFKKVIPNLITASNLTTLYDQEFDNKQSVSPTNKSSDQWSFECLRRPDYDYEVAETCRQYSVLVKIKCCVRRHRLTKVFWVVQFLAQFL
jgi:hypothetical protein